MPLEIEVKLKVDSHAPIRRRLRALGAKSAGKVRETNIFFDRPDGSLRAANCGLRVRLESRRGKVSALITFKHPPGKDAFRSREAFDVHATPPEQVIPMLKALGFEQRLLFEKDRESWRLKGCLIELDTLPHFGMFIEIEGPSVSAIQKVQRLLALENLPAVRDSYSKMVGEFLKQKNRQDFRFGEASS